MTLATRTVHDLLRSGRMTIVGVAFLVGLAAAALVPMTLVDFHLSGTQLGEVTPDIVWASDDCMGCHSIYDPVVAPMDSWQGSLMGQAGRDPLFFAQMTTANQDVANAGYFCMRCHVPMSYLTGHAADPSGHSLNLTDRDGVTCHVCHAMVDPIYKPGISPIEDKAILDAMEDKPEHYGNAMIVLDPLGRRRGPRKDHAAMHEMIPSPFHKTGDFCGTCHDVGNVGVTRLADGTYRYNAVNTPTPDEDLTTQFPLERTYTEWKLSAFAAGGVDMGGRFGGEGVGVVSSCQDCHMPRAAGRACFVGPDRRDVARHEFAGASSWPLEIIRKRYSRDPNVNVAAIDRGIKAAKEMVARAATVSASQQAGRLAVRVTNETGHKLPTGHIEGRRVFLNVAMLDADGAATREYGRYDFANATLDEPSTVVYEMRVGLSGDAAAATGLPAGVTTHMALADTIEKDNRIPPRGFANAPYGSAGAPVVGWTYADGQHWDDSCFAVPPGARTARVRLYYQSVTRHYIEALRDENVTDEWGDVLFDLWLRTDKGAPVLMSEVDVPLDAYLLGDVDADGAVTFGDLSLLLGQYNEHGRCLTGDLDLDGRVAFTDLHLLLSNFGQSLPVQ